MMRNCRQIILILLVCSKIKKKVHEGKIFEPNTLVGTKNNESFDNLLNVRNID
jgi:hypothetical protein